METSVCQIVDFRQMSRRQKAARKKKEEKVIGFMQNTNKIQNKRKRHARHTQEAQAITQNPAETKT